MSDLRMPERDADRMRDALLRDGAWEALARRRRRSTLLRVVPMACLALVLAGGLAAQVLRHPRVTLLAAERGPGDFEAMAGTVHAELASGTRQLAFPSGDREAVMSWVKSETEVTVSLADRQRRPDHARFELGGASVLDNGVIRAAVVSYRIDGQPVTLVTAPEAQVPDSPRWTLLGKEVRLHRLAGGAAVLTWSNSGQAYALVSPLPGAGQRACLMCHAGGRREATIAGLTLRP